MAWFPFFIQLTDEGKPLIKPHIKLLGGLWYCAGAGRIREGFTPEHAYRRWEEM